MIGDFSSQDKLLLFDFYKKLSHCRDEFKLYSLPKEYNAVSYCPIKKSVGILNNNRNLQIVDVEQGKTSISTEFLDSGSVIYCEEHSSVFLFGKILSHYDTRTDTVKVIYNEANIHPLGKRKSHGATCGFDLDLIGFDGNCRSVIELDLRTFAVKKESTETVQFVPEKGAPSVFCSYKDSIFIPCIGSSYSAKQKEWTFSRQVSSCETCVFTRVN